MLFRSGWLALVATLAAFVPYARVTFGSDRFDLVMLIAGLAAPCVVMTATWTALLLAADEGRLVARSQMISSVVGLLLGAPLIWLYGEKGIAGSFLVAALALAFSTWRAAVRRCPPGAGSAGRPDLRALLHIGGAFMVGEFFGQLAAYVARLVVVRAHGADTAAGLADVGFYQAAYAATGILPGFVFGAMGTDFYPRVSSAGSDGEAAEITEKQVQAALLMALPGLVGILALSHQLIGWLYAPTFAPAGPLMVWFAWAIFFNLLGWPLSYWLTARAEPGRVLAVKLLTNALLPLGTFLLMPRYGLMGAAAAYFLSNALFAVLALVLLRRRLGRWLEPRTAGWALGAAGGLLAAQWFIGTYAASPLRFLPVVLATVACGVAYLRLTRREQASS